MKFHQIVQNLLYLRVYHLILIHRHHLAGLNYLVHQYLLGHLYLRCRLYLQVGLNYLVHQYLLGHLYLRCRLYHLYLQAGLPHQYHLYLRCRLYHLYLQVGLYHLLHRYHLYLQVDCYRQDHLYHLYHLRSQRHCQGHHLLRLLRIL
jgi:hypothetical protein